MQNWPQIVNKLVSVPDLTPLFDSAYGIPQTDEDIVRIVRQYIGHSFFHYPTQVLYDQFVELAKVRGGLKVARYLFDVEMRAMSERAPGLGAMHGGELPLVFSSPEAKTFLTEKELAVSKEMQRIWIGLANQHEDPVKTRTIQFNVADQVDGSEAKGEHWKGLYLSKEASEFWKAVTKSYESS
ncbi:hypothetical protein BGZ65_002138 [Modicella reniformis]|uniref:Carboxylesterase type B domain-containing protein n=1 Tax=Modicella reniformis TaxID=1440133 RepID=A0A9P6M9T3_9FUNG|nr:hypothetical protein BGZ65_002138 [Modicella reniformis]